MDGSAAAAAAHLDATQEGQGHVQYAKHSVLKDALAGGFAGAVADGITYPMCTVKSRMQVQGAASAATALYRYKGPLDALAGIVAKEGLRGLFKGFGTVVQVAPAQFLYMGTYESWKRLLPGGHESAMAQFCGGVVATVAQSLLMVPLEVVRQRQMVQTRAQAGAYHGSINTAVTVYRTEGWRALYRGFGMTQAVWMPFNAVFLPLWEGSKQLAAHYTGAASVHELAVEWELLSAFTSSAFAAAITNPMDIVKTRLQVQGKSNVASSTSYKGALDAVATIYKTEGAAAFMRGATSRVMWVAPSTMIMFSTYDQIMKRVR
eukprot:jgi/Chlat1/744/Chrsp104S00023